MLGPIVEVKSPNKETFVVVGRKKKKRNNRNASGLSAGKGSSADLSLIVENRVPIFPARSVKMLRYSSSFVLTCTAGAVQTYIFRANDAFDPDFTSTGHQPMGFDQMMLFYNHFCVTHSRLKVTFKSTVLNVPTTVCIRQDASSTPLTTIDRILEYGGLVTCDLEATPTFGSNKTLGLDLDIAKLQGIRPPSAITADPTLRGDAASSPSEITYFHVAAWNDAGSTCSAQCSIIMEQRVIFMEPRDETES